MGDCPKVRILQQAPLPSFCAVSVQVRAFSFAFRFEFRTRMALMVGFSRLVFIKGGFFICKRMCINCYRTKAIRHHNRQIHKAKILKGGIRKANQAPYIVKGFRLWDKVLYNEQECFISGRRSSGYFALRKFDGTTITNSISFKKLRLLEPATNYLIERK